jgi:hypothetical protein
MLTFFMMHVLVSDDETLDFLQINGELMRIVWDPKMSINSVQIEKVVDANRSSTVEVDEVSKQVETKLLEQGNVIIPKRSANA